ncbi:alkaline phosphatase [Pseudoduganella namucuonensis]|uniref:Alkaline phosphatase n=1 Tax=Pseudoduganella namucuonensis TaxID=1035707 RepID=A0A1I7LIK3_9BURK|nr:alkaline phosphatase [Pseudoduganella namucuonensis]SFV09497.1 alkaline phosphatase [Pseudoduganella namucuonensis]
MKHKVWSAGSAAMAAALTAGLLAGCAGPGANKGGPAPAAPVPPSMAGEEQSLRHIILLVGDGMGFNTLTAARTYAVGEDGDLTLDTLPESAYVKTYSRDMQVTDTAAAMSAYMTGVKTNNGQLSIGGCGTAAPHTPATLLETARKRGWSAGVVNAASVTDPLTAAGYAHACQAARGDDIAAALVPGGAGYNEQLTGGLDVVLGGGAQHFHKRADGRDLLAELRAQGYTSVADAAALQALRPAAAQRVVGVFGAGKQPTLPQMTASAIDVLAARGAGFLLVVGNGQIGQAQRSSTARRALDETVALDAALKTAIAKMQAIDPGLKRTLIVMTATSDSTLILNGYSIRTGKTTPTQPGVLGLVRKYTNGAYYKDLDDVPYTIIGYGNGTHRVQGSRAGGQVLSDAIVTEAEYRQEATVRMAPGATTNGGTDVYLGAIGARAADFRGTLENTQVHTMIKTAAGW